MHILKNYCFSTSFLVVLGLLLSVHLGDDGSLLILDLLIDLGTSAGLVTVLSGSISWLLLSLLLLGLLLFLLDSGCVGEGVGNGSLVGLVQSVVSVLGCVLKLLSGVGVTCLVEKSGREVRKRRKNRGREGAWRRERSVSYFLGEQ
jgi:hypothetical protein